MIQIISQKVSSKMKPDLIYSTPVESQISLTLDGFIISVKKVKQCFLLFENVFIWSNKIFKIFVIFF